MTKKLLIGGGAILVVLLAVALIVPALIPTDVYKNQLISQIENATGRKAAIAGPFKLSVLPSLSFSAEQFSLANAPGATPADMVTLDKLTVRVALFPLLSGTVVVDSFVLERPVISLAVDQAGRPNWQMAPAGSAPATRAPGSAPGSAPAAGSGGPALSGLTLGDVRLVDGRITYTDARSGASYVVEGINMAVSLPALTSPMTADGSAVWNDEEITLAVNVANPKAFLDGMATDFAADISAAPVKLTFKGKAANGKAFEAAGALDVAVPSVRGLAAWAQNPLDLPGTGLGPLGIAGTVEMNGPLLAFKDARFRLDQIEGTGDLRYDGRAARPHASAKLALGQVDLNPYLPPEAAAGGNTTPAAPATSTAPGGAAPPQGWSDAPIDLAPLRQADVDFDLTVEGLKIRKLTLGKSQLVVTNKAGKLVADLKDMQLYGGSGKAVATIDGAGQVPGVALSFNLTGLEANPFLRDVMDFERLEGTAAAQLNVQGRGSSQRAIVSSLDGEGKVAFLNGAIRGINLAAMVRNIESAFLDKSAREQQKTDFSELTASYTIQSGVLNNQDLDLKSPLLRVSGAGQVDLPERRVSYRVEPKVVASTEGQGGSSDVGGLMVPVIVEGPWDNLSYKPDLAGLAKGKALEQLQRVVPGIGQGTTGQPGSGAQQPTTPGAPANPAEGLRRLLGR